jgi:hypothetical protein
MKVKTSELQFPALDWAVAKCADLPFPVVYDEDGRRVAVSPSTNWSQGGPIIEGERIDIHTCGSEWRAVSEATLQTETPRHYGPTPLFAAMRCYVASTLGDEVEVPDSLINI